MRHQRGVVTALLISVLLIGGVLLALTSYKVSEVRVEREQSTNDALAMAKEALIAYAVADANRPGELPCPDVNDDGQVTLAAEYSGSNCVSLIGRLPYRTLGLPDLRDDSGERLWYALSNDFHASGTVALNSDTAFRLGNTSLTITGAQPGTNLVAIVFAPGPVVRRQGATALQDRTPGPASLNAANYLDVEAGQDNADLDRNYIAAPKSETFNDRLLPIYSDDIMQLVEKRAAGELARRLREHYDAWASSGPVVASAKGFYPYAGSTPDPSVAQVGTAGNYVGLMPLSTARLVWSNIPAGCWTENAGTELRCNMAIVCILFCVPSSVSARVENIATRFVDPPTAGNVQFLGVNLGGSGTWTLDTANRRLNFTFGGIVTAGTLDIRVYAPSSSWLAGSWLVANNWHENVAYAVSPGYVLEGSGTCGGAGPSCVTVSNTGGTTDNKHAAVITSGRALPLASPPQNQRPIAPPADPAQFLEASNATLDLVFERNARTASFNDYAVAVRP
jgi:hypothetical protein